jgi:hypothetical protein
MLNIDRSKRVEEQKELRKDDFHNAVLLKPKGSEIYRIEPIHREKIEFNQSNLLKESFENKKEKFEKDKYLLEKNEFAEERRSRILRSESEEKHLHNEINLYIQKDLYREKAIQKAREERSEMINNMIKRRESED